MRNYQTEVLGNRQPTARTANVIGKSSRTKNTWIQVPLDPLVWLCALFHDGLIVAALQMWCTDGGQQGSIRRKI